MTLVLLAILVLLAKGIQAQLAIPGPQVILDPLAILVLPAKEAQAQRDQQALQAQRDQQAPTMTK